MSHYHEKTKFAHPHEKYNESESFIKSEGNDQEVQMEKVTWQHNGSAHDIAMAVIFYAHIGYILYLTYHGIVAAENWGYYSLSTTSGATSSASSISGGAPVTVSNPYQFEFVDFLISLGLALISVLLAVIWMNLLMNYAYCIIQSSLVLILGLIGWGMIAAFVYGHNILGGIAAVFFLAFLLLLIFQQKRVKFAAVNLKIASICLYDHKSLLFIPFIMAGCQLLWVVIYTFAILGAATKYMTDGESTYYFLQNTYGDGNDGTNQRSGWYWLFMLLSFLWTQKVNSGIVLVTASGVLGRWWYMGKDTDYEDGFVYPAFISACTKNIGSIALGALLVSFAETVLFVTRKIHKVLARIVAPIEKLLSYFTRYAFCCIGIYGVSFIGAGVKVIKMFKECGVTTLVNDLLLSTSLTISSFAIGVAVCVISMQIVGPILSVFGVAYEDTIYGKNDNGSKITWVGFIGLLMGYSISSLFLRTVGGLCDAAIVSFVDNPHALQQNHPDEYEEAYMAWGKIYPHYQARLQSAKVGTVVLSV